MCFAICRPYWSKILDNDSLARFTTKQLANLLPDTDADLTHSTILKCLPRTLERLHHLIDQVKMWTPGKFDHLHSSNIAFTCICWRTRSGCTATNAKFQPGCFCSIRQLMASTCFMRLKCRQYFFYWAFCGHSFGKSGLWQFFLVLYQNSTVGKNHGVAPKIGSGVIMYPNSAIIGRSNVGDNTVLSQGTGLVNCDSPGNCNVFHSADKNPTFRQLGPGQKAAAEYFRI